MGKHAVLILLCCGLLLTGCGWNGKRYTSVTPHREQRQNAQKEASSAANSLELIRVLEDMIQNRTESGVIYTAEYPAAHVESGMEVAAAYAMTTYPLGAYAVENISYEVGTTGGIPAIAVSIAYRHSDVEIRQIRNIALIDEAQPLMAAALENYEARLVMWVDQYFERDFQQMVRDYAETYPETVMEIPQVTVEVYGGGRDRVVELSFAYQTSRDSLRQMQNRVKSVFKAAELYVSGDGAAIQKYSQLYAFLMERFDYQVETSITPTYSLLHHGVGDSRAFATVYAAMCRGAGLECMTVTGTRDGEPWIWNIVKVGKIYRHVDLLRCSSQEHFQMRADREMDGYVWDYSAYPACSVINVPESEPVQNVQPEQTETTPETAPAEVPEENVVPSVPVETDGEKVPEEIFEEI